MSNAWGASTRTTTYFINSWSARVGQRLGARVIDSIVGFSIVGFVALVGPSGRPLAQCIQIVALITLFETFSVVRFGATLGMHVVHIRLAVVGSPGNPSWLQASRRTIPIALCYAIFVPGIFAALILPWTLLLSVALSPIRRGFHDRFSNTLVVFDNAPARITEQDLETWWDPSLKLIMSPWGRVPDLNDRRHARVHRVDGAWWLAALIALITIASVGITAVPWLWLWLTVVWIVLGAVDEAWWLIHAQATPGHQRAGFVVVDFVSGQPLTRGRAVLRAAVTVPLLCIPPLSALGALWVHASSLHRGPHDLLARSIVVEPGYEPPQFARPQYSPMPQFGGWFAPPPRVSNYSPPPPPPGRTTPFIPGPF